MCGAAEKAGGLCVACALGDAFGETGSTGCNSLGCIGGHELIEIIARGGMGIVYRARQSDPVREVALKALPGAELISEEARQRFRIEAQAMARLQHPAIVPIYELGEEDGTPYFTMKLAASGCLAQRIGDFKGKWREIAELIATIAEAVNYAHERGVLHRDLKPGNVLFDESGQALVSDFGLAKLIGEEADLTRTIALMGTPNYMAPEMIRDSKAVTIACDVWSLGVILYQLLAQRLPFDLDNLPAVLRAVSEDEPPPLRTDVPRDLVVIALKAMQKVPEKRYSSTHALAHDLLCWLRGEAIVARPVSALERAVLWAKRKPAMAAAIALLTLTIVTSAVLLIRSNQHLRVVDTARRQQIHHSLLAQADAERVSLVPGHTDRALALVREALTHGESTRASSVAASVLAMPDLRETRRWAVQPSVSDRQSVSFSGDLSLCLQRVPPTLVSHPAWNAGAFGLWDVAGRRWKVQMPLTEARTFVDLALSPDARHAVVAYSQFIEFWDITTGKQIRELECAVTCPGMFTTSDGSYYAVLDGQLTRCRPPSFEPEAVSDLDLGACYGLSIDPAGSSAVVQMPDDSFLNPLKHKVEVLSLANGKSIYSQAAHLHGDLEWVRKGGAFAGYEHYTGLVLVFASPFGLVPPIGLARSMSVGSRLSARSDDSWMALGDNGGFSFIRDMHTGVDVMRFPAVPMALKFSVDGSKLAYSPSPTLLAVLDVVEAPALKQARAGKLGQNIDDELAVSQDGRWVFTTGNTGAALWDTASLSETWRGYLNKAYVTVSGVSFTHDSKGIRFFSPVRGGVTWQVKEPVGGPVIVEPLAGLKPLPKSDLSDFSASANGIWSCSKRVSNQKYSLYRNGELVVEAPIPISTVQGSQHSLALSNDGRWLALTQIPGSTQGSVELSSWKPPHPVHTLSTSPCYVQAGFSPDNQWLLAGGGCRLRYLGHHHPPGSLAAAC